MATVVACTGALMMAGDSWADAFVAPWLADLAPDALWSRTPGGALAQGFILSRALRAVGAVMFGVSTLRARVFHPGVFS